MATSDMAILTVENTGGVLALKRKSALEVVSDTAFPVYGSVTGSPVVIPDAAGERLMRSVAVNIEPAQSGSGDPAPDNVRAISGWTGAVIRHGASLMDDYGWTAGMEISSSGVIQTATGNRKLSAKIPVPGLTKITGMAWTDEATGQWAFRIAAYDASDGFLSMLTSATVTAGKTVYVTPDKTIPEGTAYVRMSVFGTWSAALFDSAVFAGQNIAFPSEAGTVYGGTLDLTAGTLTVDRAMAACTSATSITKHSTPTVGGFTRFYFNPNPAMKGGTGMDGICDKLPVGKLTSTVPAVVLGVGGGSSVNILSDLTDLESFKSWLDDIGGLNIVYPLKTPVVYQLTPMQIAALAGENAFWADCGPVSVEYVRDTGTAIDAGDADTRAMIGEASGETASRSLAVGEYVTVGDKLYRVTSAVGAGETLVPGSNVTQTTVGAELARLAAMIS